MPSPVPIQTVFHPASRFTTAGQFFGDILTIMLIVAGVMAISFIIVGGIKMITASGDPKALESARGTVLHAIMGLVFVVLAFVIIQVVQYLLNSNIPITT